MSQKKYNGHPSRRLWNLALWFGNDEGLYNLAREAIRRAKTRDEAARAIVEALHDCGSTATPDGYRYSVSGVRYAIRHL